MKATELRINNLVYNDFTRKQMEVYPMMIVQLSKMDNLDNSNIKPIPLTEDWLLKFGFEYKVEELGVKFYELQIGISFISISIEGHFNINSGESYWYMDRDFKTPKYVHQLQNLYFALTNEELTFKSE